MCMVFGTALDQKTYKLIENEEIKWCLSQYAIVPVSISKYNIGNKVLLL